MNILQHKQEISYIKSLEFMEGFKTAYEQQGYDVLLTLTFVDGRSITKELADHKLDIFLRQLDRLYFGKIKGKQYAQKSAEGRTDKSAYPALHHKQSHNGASRGAHCP